MPIPCCYFSKEGHIKSVQIHGFSDASKHAYAGVVYIKGVDTQGSIHVSLVTSKIKVAPIKQHTIPRLELWSTTTSSIVGSCERSATS